MPTHAENRRLPYSPEQMFDLVAAIEDYPHFLPWCESARIREREGNTLEAELVIGFKVFRERFTSQVVLDRPRRIDATYAYGPFRYLNNHWIFAPAEGGCVIDFYVDFALRSWLLQRLIGAVFYEAIRRMAGAFESRAHELYGRRPHSTTLAGTEPRPDRV